MKSITHFLFVLTASMPFILTSACSTIGEPAKSTSALPVESSSSIASARVTQLGNTVYVTGAVKPVQGRPQTLAAHIDAELINSKGQVIATSQAPITARHPRTVQGHIGRYPYTVSFPAEQAGQAGKVVVTYHAGSHDS